MVTANVRGEIAFSFKQKNHSKDMAYYVFGGMRVCCMCQNFDTEEYYTTNDADLLVNTFTTTLAFLKINWKQMLGRPTITLVATHSRLGMPSSTALDLIL